MTTDSDRRFADLAMKAANQRTHQLIALAASQARIAALEFDISARVEGQRSDHERIAALEVAARGVYACVVGSANEPDPPSMMTQVCRVMLRTTQFERLAALLEGDTMSQEEWGDLAVEDVRTLDPNHLVVTQYDALTARLQTAGARVAALEAELDQVWTRMMALATLARDLAANDDLPTILASEEGIERWRTQREALFTLIRKEFP